VQRDCIWWGSVAANRVPAGDKSCSSSPDRNLLDFIDMTVDKTGRVLVGYADGCVGRCVKDASFHSFKTADGDEDKDDNATIARQTCGRGLFAAYDDKPEGPLRACAAAAIRPVAGTVGNGGKDVTPPAAAPSGGQLAATGASASLPAVGLLLLAGVLALGARRRVG
jgi:hypothetical protein